MGGFGGKFEIEQGKSESAPRGGVLMGSLKWNRVDLNQRHQNETATIKVVLGRVRVDMWILRHFQFNIHGGICRNFLK